MSGPALAVGRRGAFGFALAYSALYFFPFPLNALPGGWGLARAVSAGTWGHLVPWVARAVLRLPQAVAQVPTNSGDSAFAWVQWACTVGLAALFAVAWAAFMRPERASSPQLREWLRTYVRFAVGWTLLGYGFAKVFPMQFGWLPERLIEPYGESSPQALLWTFMGFSRPYQVFTGLAEVLGGALLFFRRTTTLGALLLAGVLANVAALNYCYDVPVKLSSTHLLLFAVALLAPEVRRLASAVLLDRGVEPRAPAPPLFQRPRWTLAARVTGVLFAAYQLFNGVTGGISAAASMAEAARASPIAGLYRVERHQDQEAPPGAPVSELDHGPWIRVAAGASSFGVLFADGTFRRYWARLDAPARALVLSRKDLDGTITLHWERSDAGQLVLRGDRFAVHLAPMDPADSMLLSRGFHWVSEYTFNR
ncbi:MAG TPA: hypothetical protein VND93_19015 [Myxococcales bacterium]|nr:hypothetical protein [Myxococcales bacterium]